MNAITTQKANCRDCHRCMRSCLVKAIAIEKGQARLIDRKCILCGRCVVECPQQAKKVNDDLTAVRQAIIEGRQVVLSLAPSAVANFMDYDPEVLVQSLYALGFAAVEETAVGAEVVSKYYRQMLDNANKPVISACCPVVVNIVTKFYPELTDNLATVVSPMVAHAKLLKKRLGKDAFVVFAGPCIAKIAEKEQAAGAVDAVITFTELREWLKTAQIEAGTQDRTRPEVRDAWSKARFYPVAGGILQTFAEYDCTDTEVIAVDGIENCMAVFEAMANREIAPRFIEALACSGGCINGPVSGNDKCVPAKKVKVAEFACSSQVAPGRPIPEEIDFRRMHEASQLDEYTPTETEIRAVLKKTGKYEKQDEKNCGACGYNTCREKAIAVCQGLTQIDTCVPYMRSKAESFANVIVDNSLNAIIVVDEKLNIQEFNPAAEAMFDRKKEMVKGRMLTEIMDCSEILAAAHSGKRIAGKRVELAGTGLVANQMIVPVPENGVIFLVMTDITAQEKNARELEQVKQQTVEKATEIINKQMQVAQEIAGLLGETTAETKAALLELVWVLQAKGDK